jgi:hypothetical protein
MNKKRDMMTLFNLYVVCMHIPSNQTLALYCSLHRGLPIDVTNTNYYKCSESFVQTQWEQIPEKPVEVKVLESAISGSDECKFQIQPVKIY